MTPCPHCGQAMQPTASDLDAPQLREWYGVEGLGLAAIAERTGADVDQVRLALQRQSLYRRHRGKLSPS